MVPRQVVQNCYGYGCGVEAKQTMIGASASASGGGGVPMDLDALRYSGVVTSPFHGNVQFDRHPTEGGEWLFGVERV